MIIIKKKLLLRHLHPILLAHLARRNACRVLGSVAILGRASRRYCLVPGGGGGGWRGGDAVTLQPGLAFSIATVHRNREYDKIYCLADDQVTQDDGWRSSCGRAPPSLN